MNEYTGEILLSDVNTFIGAVFIASFALGAGLIIWNAAVGSNPVERAIYTEIYLANVN